MWAELHQNVKIRIINSFLSRMVGGAVFPFMAIYFSQHLGAGTAGLLLMVLVGIEFVAGLYGGGLADAWGRSRTSPCQSVDTASLVHFRRSEHDLRR